MKTPRWIAAQTQYEPPHQSSNWGAACIEFEFTDRIATCDDHETDPLTAFHREAVGDAENTRKTLRLFSHDQSYRDLLSRWYGER